MKHAKSIVPLTIASIFLGLVVGLQRWSVDEPNMPASSTGLDNRSASNVLYRMASQRLQGTNLVCILVTKNVSGWQGGFMMSHTGFSEIQMMGVTITLDTDGNLESFNHHQFCKPVAIRP